MNTSILTPYQRDKQDLGDDSIFYSEPRFVHHLDSGFRRRLTNLYRQYLFADSIILDLMSSWVSHLPEDVEYKKVIGHGLNRVELENNKRLESFWIQDLNKDQDLPFADSSIDTCLMVAAWQYLQEPEQLAYEIRRITKPSGKLIISFSNRAFWTKTPRIWREGTDQDHIAYIKSVLYSQGWSSLEHIAEVTKSEGLLGLFGGNGDPFFSVIAKP